MTYPRWATERSDEAPAGGDPTSSAEPRAGRPPERRRMHPLRRFLLILAAVLIAVILAIIGADLIANPGLAAAVGHLPALVS